MLPDASWQQRAVFSSALLATAAATTLLPGKAPSPHPAAVPAASATLTARTQPAYVGRHRKHLDHLRHVEYVQERSRAAGQHTVLLAAPAQPSDSPRGYAESLVGAAQFGCLNELWSRESGWDATAANPSSGAYGIPQALPGSKMAAAGADWATDPATQIRWGVLDYIDPTYGSPCGAWSHEEAVGWY